MHFCLRRAKERTIRTRPSTASPRNFFFLLSFLTGDPDISLWPSTEGLSREGSSKYHRWLCADISAVLPLMAEPRVNGGSNFDSLKVSAESVRWEGNEVRINGERTMGRQRREQWTAIDEDGVILSNFYTPQNDCMNTVDSVTNTWSIQQTPMFHGCTISNKQNVEPWKLSTSWGHTKVLLTCC